MYEYVPLHTCQLITVGRYLGLFGDHIVLAVLHQYTQVFKRADLISSKESMEAV